jgi:hypothetical protein
MQAWLVRGFYFALLAALVAGCVNTGPVKDASERAADAIDNAVTTIDHNSGAWQTTLRDLVTQLQGIEKNTANDVDQISQRAISTTGGEFRCDTDFVADRVKQHLRYLADKLRGKPSTPPRPGLCNVVPAAVDMGNRLNLLEYFGYDLDSAGVELLLQDDSGATSLHAWTAVPTHCHMTLNTAPTNGVPICNRNNRKIVLKWGNEVLSTVDVVQASCPAAPPAPTPLPMKTAYKNSFNDNGGFVGISKERADGVPCTAGYHRYDAYAHNTAGGNVGHCEVTGWQEDNPNSCVATVHVGARPGQAVDCEILIREVGDQLPAPPAPPCNCR